MTLNSRLSSPNSNSVSIYLAGGNTAAVPAYGFAVDTSTGTFAPATGTFAIATAASERLRIDSSGNVGIGTTAPAQRLDVNGNGVFSGYVTATGLVQSGYGSATVYSSPLATWAPSSGGVLKTINGTAVDGASTHAHFQVTNANGNSQTAWIGAVSNTGAGVYTPSIVIGQQTSSGGSTERMRIDSSGNVGISAAHPFRTSFIR